MKGAGVARWLHSMNLASTAAGRYVNWWRQQVHQDKIAAVHQWSFSLLGRLI